MVRNALEGPRDNKGSMEERCMSTSTSLNKISDFLFPFLIEPVRESIRTEVKEDRGAFYTMGCVGPPMELNEVSARFYQVKRGGIVLPNTILRACEKVW